MAENEEGKRYLEQLMGNMDYFLRGADDLVSKVKKLQARTEEMAMRISVIETKLQGALDLLAARNSTFGKGNWS